MGIVSAFNEWDPLEEVIVGRVEGARVPRPDPGLHALEFAHLQEMREIPSGPFCRRAIDETAEDLDILAEELTKLGIIVRRPCPVDHARVYRTPDWESDGLFNYCPRDSLLVIGDVVIEAPMVLRARQFENLAYRHLLTDYLKGGARWISAPRPRLLDTVYRSSDGFHIAIDESEPLFDAANVARCGRDLFYLVSDSGNHLGARWLSQTLGPQFRVHPLDRLRNTTHIDTTLVLVRPGLVFVPAPFVTEHNLPPMLRDWDVVYVDDLVDGQPCACPQLSSKWVGLNLLMVNPSLAIVDSRQHEIIRQLERRGIDTLPLQLRHARTLGGGFHCVTLDVRRRGSLESYWN
jgi:N-dimethylarginine dimethylaminohydrolase